MNLITDPWIPIRRADGSRQRIRPCDLTGQLTTNPVVALAAPRPDFNGALAQFLIGLLQTVFRGDDEDWEEWLEGPPNEQELSALFSPITHAFSLDGDGPRFMQDLDPNMGGTENSVFALLLEAPGDQTKSNNADHFIKRDQVRVVCPCCAALALFSLQINAPSGGQGNRTSLRGGGPLTTLVSFEAPSGTGNPPPLWRDLWLNVLPRAAFYGGWAAGDATEHWFPWLVATRTSEQAGTEITPASAHPAIMYWATPRRIRLDWTTTAAGDCGLCGERSEALLIQYFAKNYGANYMGWPDHPISPHYRKDENTLEWLPIHPQPGGMGYRHWPELLSVAGTRKAARVVREIADRRRHPAHINTQIRLWAFGYDMDNMKARCWYEAHLPLIEVPPSGDPKEDARCRQLLVERARSMVEAASQVKGDLVFALKQAWFDRPKDAKGDFGFMELAYWDATEPGFYVNLRRYAEALTQEEAEQGALREEIGEAWRQEIARAALRLFDQWAASSAMEYENPERIARAHHELRKKLYGTKIRQQLGLATAPVESGTKKGRKHA